MGQAHSRHHRNDNIYDTTDLHEYIKFRTPDALRKLLQKTKPAALELYNCAGFTPLLLSLECEKYEAAFLLLEQGANPDAYFKSNHSSEKRIMQIYMDAINLPFCQDSRIQQAKACIRLLTLYGASIEGLTLGANEQQIKEIFTKTQALREVRHIAEQKINSDNKYLKAQGYQELQEVWHNLASAEDYAACKVQYTRKAFEVGQVKQTLKSSSYSIKLFNPHAQQELINIPSNKSVARSF